MVYLSSVSGYSITMLLYCLGMFDDQAISCVCKYYLFIVTGVGGMYSWEVRCINRCDGSSVQDTSASILGQNWSWSWVPAPHTAWALVKVEFRYVISVCELHQDCVITNENWIYCLRTILV